MSNDSTVTIGVAPPPPGIVPDFDHPRDAGQRTHYIVIALLTALVTVTFFLRCYAKITITTRFLAEDWFCFAAWLSTVFLSICIFAKLRFGEGHHVWEVRQEDDLQIEKWLYASSIIYSTAAFFTKLTILIFTMRIFAVTHTIRRAFQALVAFNVLAFLSIAIAKLCICIPAQAFWDPTITNARCIDQAKLFIFDSTLSIATDLLVLLGPVMMTWALRVTPRKKLKIWAMLSGGGAAVGLAGFRMAKVIEFQHTTDPTVDIIPLNWTVSAELTIGIICACLPAINVLAEKHWKKKKKRHSGNRVPANRPRSTGWNFSKSREKRKKQQHNNITSILAKISSGSSSGRSKGTWKSFASAVRSPTTVVRTESNRPVEAEEDEGLELFVVDRARTISRMESMAPLAPPSPAHLEGQQETVEEEVDIEANSHHRRPRA